MNTATVSVAPVAQIARPYAKSLTERIGDQAGFTNFDEWEDLFLQLEEGRYQDGRAVIEFIDKCEKYFHEADRDLRKELLENHRSFVVALARTNGRKSYGRMVQPIMLHLEISSRFRAGEYLKAVNVVSRYYRALRAVMPMAVMDKIGNILRFHRNGEGFTPAEIEFAGYTKTVQNKHRAYVHPVTGDTFTFEKLSGTALMNAEAIAKATAANKAAKKVKVKASPEETKRKEKAAMKAAEKKAKEDAKKAKKGGKQ